MIFLEIGYLSSPIYQQEKTESYNWPKVQNNGSATHQISFT